MEALEILQTLGMVAGSITTIIACLLLLFKPIRRFFMKRLIQQTEDNEQKELIKLIHKTLLDHIDNNTIINEAMLSMLRSNITNTYYKYINADGIPMYVRENLVKEYCVYHQFNGNGYIDVIYEELMAKPPLKN